MRKDILRNIKWLEDRDKFLELYDKIIKNGEIIVNIENDTISSDILKDFLEDILSGNMSIHQFEYSPIGKIFTDGLAKEDKSKKVGLSKRLKNIEDNLLRLMIMIIK